MQYNFDFVIRPTLRLQAVEEILRRQKILQPVPSRQTLINMIEDGTLEGKKIRMGYVVYQDSFNAFVRDLQPNLKAA